MKTCSKCNTEKHETEFAFKNKSKGKLHVYCKICHKNYSKQHYSDNHKYYIDKAKKSKAAYMAAHSDFINKYKSLKGCKHCSENDPCCLDFHHTDEESKEFNISRARANKSLTNIMNEIDKCEVLCSNCHRKLHAGRILKCPRSDSN